MSDCTTQDNCSPTQPASANCCPVEQGVAMWKSSFMAAMQQAQTQILAEKIKAKWGSILEAEADATIDAMAVCWQTTLAKAKSEVALRDSFRKIYESAAGE